MEVRMLKKWQLLTLIVILTLFLAACAAPQQETTNADQVVVEEEDQGELEDEVVVDEEEEEQAPAIDAAAIYATRCARCHAADRSGNNGPALLPERLTQDASIYEATITNGSGPMPSFGNRLSAEEISALVEFILSEPE
jgi:mono/diheme cytochrome c family protein